MIFRTAGPPTEGAGHPSWHWMVITSVVIHAAALACIWGLERYTPRRTFNPSVISVSLVGALPGASLSPPSPTSSQKPDQSRPSPPSPPVESKARVPVPVPQAERQAVSINPTEVKVPVRTPPVYKPETHPTPSPPKLATGQAPRPGAETGPRAAAAGQTGGSGGLTAEEARYLQMLQARIEESWRAYLHQEEGVLGEVRIQISPDGRVREFIFLKGSGQAYVDASIVNALKKVALAPPPASLADRPLILRFWPSGPKP